MRSFYEQARIVKAVLYFLISVVLCAGVFLLLLAPKLAPDAGLTNKILSIDILAKAISMFSTNLVILIVTCIIAGVLLLVIPIIVLVVVVRKLNAPSQFPEGINKRKFKLKDHYILNELLDFFFSGGLTLSRGYDAEEVFTARGVHFASIRFKKGSIYVLIDKDYDRVSQRDRSGHIIVDTADSVNVAKDRIYSAYITGFSKAKTAPLAKAH
ncbi:MAG: hypothetical protein LBE09_07030 [Christensenellaceae bacterium]|jgi:hypothetical protein|nr:hypothetical protein [Christensenellaceae bacterium]